MIAAATDGEENGEENGEEETTPPQRMGFWDLLDHIVEEPPPRLPRGGRYTDAFRAFIGACLNKTPKERAAAAAQQAPLNASKICPATRRRGRSR